MFGETRFSHRRNRRASLGGCFCELGVKRERVLGLRVERAVAPFGDLKNPPATAGGSDPADVPSRDAGGSDPGDVLFSLCLGVSVGEFAV